MLRRLPLPRQESTSENRSLVFSTGNNHAVSFTDAAAGVSTDSLTLSVAHGMLTLAWANGLSFTAGTNGSASFTCRALPPIGTRLSMA